MRAVRLVLEMLFNVYYIFIAYCIISYHITSYYMTICIHYIHITCVRVYIYIYIDIHIYRERDV